MIKQCCVAGPTLHRLARRLPRVTASILPAAVLVFLPKCPLCLAAWLTVATGVSFSMMDVVWVCASIVLVCVAALVPVIWRRSFGGVSAFFVDCTEVPQSVWTSTKGQAMGSGPVIGQPCHRRVPFNPKRIGSNLESEPSQAHHPVGRHPYRA